MKCNSVADIVSSSKLVNNLFYFFIIYIRRRWQDDVKAYARRHTSVGCVTALLKDPIASSGRQIVAARHCVSPAHHGWSEGRDSGSHHKYLSRSC